MSCLETGVSQRKIIQSESRLLQVADGREGSRDGADGNVSTDC